MAVASYYCGAVLLLDPDRCRVTKTISLGAQPQPDAARRGEFVFHDGRHCFQHWLSCSTCHPDGRADGMNWDLVNDGIGNPKNARSLLWSHKTPPVMSLGVRESMEEAAEKGFQFIQFREIDPGDLKAVQAYLRPWSPRRARGWSPGGSRRRPCRANASSRMPRSAVRGVILRRCSPRWRPTMWARSTSWTAAGGSIRRRASSCGARDLICTTAVRSR